MSCFFFKEYLTKKYYSATIQLTDEVYFLADKGYTEVLPRVCMWKVACFSAMSLRQQKHTF